jgi:flagellar biosynthesis/type III secretory pathway M-ring protein FliF/YscJ
MFESEFGGVLWLPFALLGLVLCVGYVVWRVLEARGRTRRAERAARGDRLERELAEQLRRARAGTHEEEPEEGVLEPPRAERERLEALRRAAANPDRKP